MFRGLSLMSFGCFGLALNQQIKNEARHGHLIR